MAVITDPDIVALAEPGETPWEGFSDSHVFMQRDCPTCDKGLLYAPARFCGQCGGTGRLVRFVPLTDPETTGA